MRKLSLPQIPLQPVKVAPLPVPKSIPGDARDPLFSCISRALLSLPSHLQTQCKSKIAIYTQNNVTRLCTRTLRGCVAARFARDGPSAKVRRAAWVSMGLIPDDSPSSAIKYVGRKYPGDLFALETIEKVTGLGLAAVGRVRRVPSQVRLGWSSLIESKGSNEWSLVAVGTKGAFMGCDAWKDLLN